MLLLQTVSLGLWLPTGIHLISIRMVVRQRRMDLGQGKMRYLCGDLFRSVAQLVPYGNAADGNARACNPQATAPQISGLCVSNVPISVTVAMIECSTAGLDTTSNSNAVGGAETRHGNSSKPKAGAPGTPGLAANSKR